MMPLTRSRRPMNKIGRRTQDWKDVWRFLKPRLRAANRVGCEFEFMVHECNGPLDPCHSRKRNQMSGNAIYEIALGCRRVHEYLDGVNAYPPLGRRLTHTEMERAVKKAIRNNGGLILPNA